MATILNSPRPSECASPAADPSVDTVAPFANRVDPVAPLERPDFVVRLAQARGRNRDADEGRRRSAICGDRLLRQGCRRRKTRLGSIEITPFIRTALCVRKLGPGEGEACESGIGGES